MTQLEPKTAEILKLNRELQALRREKAQAEAELRESHEEAAWLARLPEENPNPVLRVAADGLVLYGNPASTQSPGWNWEKGQPLGDALCPLLERAFTQGRQAQEILTLGEKHYEVSIVPVPEEGYANVYGRDVTEPKRMEDELRRSHESLEQHVEQRSEQLRNTLDRLRLITENISEVFWMADARLERMLYVSFNYRRIWGAVSEEIERRPSAMLESLHPEDRPRAARWLAGLRGGGAPEIDYRVVWPDGTIRHIRQSGLPVRGADGGITSFVGVAQDVTERVRTEAEKARLASHLQQAQKMQALGQLAGGVAHDFNNLLSVIAGYCGLILDDAPQDEAFRQRIIEIQGATEEASALTKQLLAFSRRQVLEAVVVSPNEPLRKMARMLRSVLGEKTELCLRLAEETGRIRIDPAQLEQVILNLAFNSRDAMPAGGKLIIETANLSVPQAYEGLVPGEYVQVSVSDTGTGIPKDIQDKIFEPFFTTKPKGQGTGLGLAMVYGAVKQQEGEIFLHSEPGVGTTLRLCFKRVAGAAAAAHPVKAAKRRPGRGERVLLVEDEARVRMVMTEMLSRGGYAVTAAASAEEALALFGRGGGFDLVVSDVIMPGLNGAQLAARLRARTPGLPVIFCSGYAGDMIASGGAGLGDSPLFTKPVDPDRLLRKMRELLDLAARAGV